MRFSSRFLRLKEENQHFPQMSIIWHKIKHFHTTKSIWRQKKITNMSKRFDYHMSKLSSWRFGYVKIDQHLLLEPSTHKQRKLSCARNISCYLRFCIKSSCMPGVPRLFLYGLLHFSLLLCFCCSHWLFIIWIKKLSHKLFKGQSFESIHTTFWRVSFIN